MRDFVRTHWKGLVALVAIILFIFLTMVRW
jgi:hypothetical protein